LFATRKLDRDHAAYFGWTGQARATKSVSGVGKSGIASGAAKPASVSIEAISAAV
jgi:hypothetical protein